jgi:hypothetical protein
MEGALVYAMLGVLFVALPLRRLGRTFYAYMAKLGDCG